MPTLKITESHVGSGQIACHPLFKHDIFDTREIEAHGEFVKYEVVEKRHVFVTLAKGHIKMIKQHVEKGFNHLHFVNSSLDNRGS